MRFLHPKKIEVETCRIDYRMRTPKVEKLSLQPISLLQGPKYVKSVFASLTSPQGVQGLGFMGSTSPQTLKPLVRKSVGPDLQKPAEGSWQPARAETEGIVCGISTGLGLDTGFLQSF